MTSPAAITDQFENDTFDDQQDWSIISSSFFLPFIGWIPERRIVRWKISKFPEFSLAIETIILLSQPLKKPGSYFAFSTGAFSMRGKIYFILEDNNTYLHD